MIQARIALWLAGHHGIRTALLLAALFIVFTPVLFIAGVVSVLSHTTAQACQALPVTNAPAGSGPAPSGRDAQPLRLQPGRWYEVGATEYGGPEDPSSGDYGSIPDSSQSYLPAHPDTFAELSVESTNPANHGTFTSADANALNHLPYMTALRVAHAGHQAILHKRDIGYGQGPGQHIANGEPYRLDVWWQAARPLQISKSAVQIQLAPPTGAGQTLEQLPISSEAPAGTGAEDCPAGEAGGGTILPLTPGTRTTILPSGLAAAGQQAPEAVKQMVAAGNRLFGASYLYGGGHGATLDTLQAAYDCSSAVSYLLHAAGALGPSSLDSTGLAGYGQPGPGRYVSIYANSAHAFIYVAGLRFDTSYHGTDTGPNAGTPGPRWRVSSSIPDWATWTVRHSPGL